MTALADFHAAFHAAATGGDQAPLHAFIRGDKAGVRVYRNNVVRAIADSLGSSYPAVRRLVGDNWFDAAAAAYLRETPPRARSLVGYGEDFPEFIDELAAGSLPWLGAVARLDRAWLEAHVAEDAAPLTVADFADADVIQSTRCALHPSARIVVNQWVVHAVWAANRSDDEDAHTPREVRRETEACLIWRSEHEVRHRALSAGEAVFLRAIESGVNLGEASARAQDADGDVAQIFAGALAAGVLIGEGKK